MRAVTVGLFIAGAALMTACSSQNGAAPATTTTTTVTSTATGSPSTSASAQPVQKPASQKPASQKPTDSIGKDVNCSANGAGKVGPAGGKQVDLIAVATKTGTVGCTEAFNIISDYYRDAPTKSEGTAHHLTVQGWNCLADTGAQGTGMIGCDKEGLAFHTAQ